MKKWITHNNSVWSISRQLRIKKNIELNKCGHKTIHSIQYQTMLIVIFIRGSRDFFFFHFFLSLIRFSRRHCRLFVWNHNIKSTNSYQTYSKQKMRRRQSDLWMSRTSVCLSWTFTMTECASEKTGKINNPTNDKQNNT